MPSGRRTDFELPQAIDEAHITLKPMVRATFDTDADGTPLSEPATLLIAGSSRISIDQDTYPFGTDLWTRIGEGQWERTVVTTDVERPCDGSAQLGTRSMALYRDAVLDQDWLFVGCLRGCFGIGMAKRVSTSRRTRWEHSSLWIRGKRAGGRQRMRVED
ncbi:MAG: hypothetical protein ACOC1F_01665 [Myxococcota bacterium]